MSRVPLYRKIYTYYLCLNSFFTRRKRARTDRIVVAKFDGLGDFILFLDMARAIKRAFPNRELVLLCSRLAAPIALQSSIFDRVVVIRKTEERLRNLRKLKRKLRSCECDIFLQASVSRDLVTECLTNLIVANRKITPKFEMTLPDKLISRLSKRYDEIVQINMNDMALAQNASIASYIIGKEVPPNVYLFENIPSVDLPLPPKYYVFVLGASEPWKRYPIEKWQTVARKIYSDTQLPCVLIGNQKDMIDVDRFIDGTFECYSLIEKTTVIQLISVISKAQFVVGNDTLAMHIAASCNVKALCVSLATNGDRFYPYICGEQRPICIKHHPECQGCTSHFDTHLMCLDHSQDPPTARCFNEIELSEILDKISLLY